MCNQKIESFKSLTTALAFPQNEMAPVAAICFVMDRLRKSYWTRSRGCPLGYGATFRVVSGWKVVEILWWWP